MSQEDVVALLARVRHDAGLRARLQDVTTADALEHAAGSLGFTLRPAASADELTDEDPDAISSRATNRTCYGTTDCCPGATPNTCRGTTDCCR